MTAPVNSDQRRRRKRAGVWGWITRRFGALVVTMAALISVNWISPRLSSDPAAPSPPTPTPSLAAQPASKSVQAAFKPDGKPGWVDLVQPSPPTRTHRRRPVFNSSRSAQIDGLEVLSADELDGISQAH